ncbi:hypothetical protein [Desulfobacca acetoxidans]|uniref:Uncharacterized protein n=1 Tax=Desulfobacca acetoxidans (strain ATCC 700848 / DSM 11109 / ASRB2) TaxID=880072 RepID=F2NJP0_DESAR|nr:hypothetical protein [Desulfobacca acetoxidans]AEB09695.1 hypothetical protein Desac_1857 [Desulfobacca acetoxidans DSM 11109]
MSLTPPRKRSVIPKNTDRQPENREYHDQSGSWQDLWLSNLGILAGQQSRGQGQQ